MICAKCGAWVRQTEERCGYCGQEPTEAARAAAAATAHEPSTPFALTPAQPGGAQPTPAGEFASPWSRYWARLLDVGLTLIVVIAVTVVVAPQSLDVLKAKLNLHLADQVLGILLLPFAMTLDALIYALCGNTPAKWLCGIRAADVQGQKIRPLAYLVRNLNVYAYGLALGVGVLILFTCIHNYRRVSSGLQTSWDERLGTRVLRVRASAWRTTLTASLYLLLTLGGAVMTIVLGPMLQQSELDMLAAQLNKGTPRTIDAASRLERVTVDSGRTLEFDYTLLDVSADDADRENFTLQLDSMRKELAHSFCTDMPSIAGLESVRYRYTGKDQRALGTIEVSRQECARHP